MKQMMRVLPVFGRLQPNFEAFDAGVRRFVGWQYDPTVGAEDEKGVAQGGFVMKLDGEMVPVTAEYILALKQGDLLPADEISAKFAPIGSFQQI